MSGLWPSSARLATAQGTNIAVAYFEADVLNEEGCLLSSFEEPHVDLKTQVCDKRDSGLNPSGAFKRFSNPLVSCVACGKDFAQRRVVISEIKGMAAERGNCQKHLQSCVWKINGSQEASASTEVAV